MAPSRSTEREHSKLEQLAEKATGVADGMADAFEANQSVALSQGQATADTVLGHGRGTREELDDAETTRAFVGGSVMMVARGIIVAVVALIVLGALYNTDIVSNPQNANQWTNMTTTFADYGTTAFTLIGVGLIAVGAGTALAYFGGMGGGGGR